MEARSNSRSEGRADCVDIRTSSDGRGNSSKIFRYLERLEVDSGERGVGDIVGDIVSECVSLGLPREGGGLELARDGGDRRSGEGFSISGEVTEVDGGTTVASDFWLPDLRLISLLGGNCGCDGSDGCDFSLASLATSFAPFSSASSVISISRRRRRELEDEVIEPVAV